MPENKTDRRHFQRRELGMPVAYATDRELLASFFVGWTVNVHQKGACIQTKSGQVPEKGSQLTLLVMSDANDNSVSSDVSVTIKGTVAWTRRASGEFGVQLFNGD